MSIAPKDLTKTRISKKLPASEVNMEPGSNDPLETNADQNLSFLQATNIDEVM